MISAFGVDHGISKGWSRPDKAAKLASAWARENSKSLGSNPRADWAATRWGNATHQNVHQTLSTKARNEARKTYKGAPDKLVMARSMRQITGTQRRKGRVLP